MPILQVRLKHLQHTVKVPEIKPVVLANPMQREIIALIAFLLGEILLQPNLYGLISAYVSQVTVKVAVLEEDIIGSQVLHGPTIHPGINLNPVGKLQLIVYIGIYISKYGRLAVSHVPVVSTRQFVVSQLPHQLAIILHHLLIEELPPVIQRDRDELHDLLLVRHPHLASIGDFLKVKTRLKQGILTKVLALTMESGNLTIGIPKANLPSLLPVTLQPDTKSAVAKVRSWAHLIGNSQDS
mgnify:CR=1 FL=1